MTAILFIVGAETLVGGLIFLVPRLWGCYDPTMTEAIAFDTHRFVKRLTESGFTEKQAETLAEEHVALLNANLATKADIEVLRQETKTGIEALRYETKADIAKVEAAIDALRQETKADIARVEAGMETLRQETTATIATVKADLVKWLFGGMIAQGGLIVALVKLL